ncbi:MAG: acyltransferase family protein [Erysipelotrichaceae bacterium]|nr:acyltransferase family protein [Erysipelotrichaceae bacterium]
MNKTTSVKHEHLNYIDAAKGVLICLVILGHVFMKYEIMRFAFTFHLSSFLIISGILIFHVRKTERSLFRNIIDAIYVFIIPYIFFETIGASLKYFSGTELSIHKLVYDSLTVNCHIGADWYLPAAFFAEIIFYTIEKIPVHKFLKIPVYIASFAAGALLPREPFSYIFLDRILISLAFIAAGYYLYDLYTSVHWWLIILSAITVYECTIHNGFVSLYRINIGNPLLYLTGALFGAYLCISLCHLFPSKVLQIIGKNSLILMGTHQNFINYLNVDSLSLLLIICIMSIPLVALIRTFLPFCVGIRKKKNLSIA